jgi:hypothetical protein
MLEFGNLKNSGHSGTHLKNVARRSRRRRFNWKFMRMLEASRTRTRGRTRLGSALARTGAVRSKNIPAMSTSPISTSSAHEHSAVIHTSPNTLLAFQSPDITDNASWCTSATTSPHESLGAAYRKNPLRKTARKTKNQLREPLTG